ncbi:MAG: Rrf2 family transcriptional regulator [Nitrospira sp.]|nr:Rrf2 family transcriptional regulator [Nitrospira sp.]MCA9481314.1 Rrf2 family transcriptional regulator [Nitrospira sp.]MCB9711721.1 Rrf2 family transcriptional regulator [Nitrospiraceae bacterium]MDR4488693.1 Rrf2 family transcriptional regulator [Nitrospirales bacterium]
MNRFPIKVTYGIMATVELARHKDTQPLQAKVIAQRQRIPTRFIEQIMQRLKQAGIVRSARGAQGGYTLTKTPSQISLASLVNSMNGAQRELLNGITDNNGNSNQRPLSTSLLSGIWQQVEEAEQGILNNISIQSLLEQYEKLETQRALMYHI